MSSVVAFLLRFLPFIFFLFFIMRVGSIGVVAWRRGQKHEDEQHEVANGYDAKQYKPSWHVAVVQSAHGDAEHRYDVHGQRDARQQYDYAHEAGYQAAIVIL